jgi:hypothetical protein
LFSRFIQREVDENKTSHRIIPWLVGFKRTDVFAAMQASRSGCFG